MLCTFFFTQNDINDIPFFDVELPYELALKIFQFLDRCELGRCAQVKLARKCCAELMGSAQTAN